MQENVIGIIDEPNPKGKSDSLGIERHIDALTTFVEACPTPMTIGVQGEWGSGKTSMLNAIHHRLEEKSNVRQIWVNAWECALLASPEDALVKVVSEIISELIKFSVDKQGIDKLKKISSLVFKNALKVGGALTNSRIGDLADDFLASGRPSISELRASLQELVEEQFINKADACNKIVIYIDDLDRVEPKEAVKLLELLKNIFSIQGCVFLLAIDYEIVVKGLKDKFGERSKDNDWEFRAFFDKIIQLPYAMPVSQFNIGQYVKGLLAETTFVKSNDLDEEHISTVVENSVGGNPRAIKRLLNSILLLNLFVDHERGRKNKNILINQQKLLFTLVALQTAYPSIYEIVLAAPNVEKWDNNLAFEITRLKEETEKKEFEKALGIFRQREEFNSAWTDALFRVCYINDRLYSKVSELCTLLTSIIDLKEELNQQGKGNLVKQVFAWAQLTEIASSAKPSDGSKRSKQNYGKPIKHFIKQIHETLKTDDVYTRSQLEKKLEDLILKDTGKVIRAGTRDAQIRKHILNDPVRVHYQVNKSNHSEFDLFYYEKDGKTGKHDPLRKYASDMNMPEITILFADH